MAPCHPAPDRPEREGASPGREAPSVVSCVRAREQLTDPSVVRLPDGSWRMAISLGQQTVMARSTDGGSTWLQEGVVVPPGPAGQRIVCDPSLVAGAGRFLYKTAP